MEDDHMPRRTKADAVDLTDNGAAYCGSHLGASAKMTGRDISGQPIHEVTPPDVRAFGSFVIACEECGREASTLHRPDSLLIVAR